MGSLSAAPKLTIDCMQTPPELNPSFDIAILGSGISCSLSLLHLLEKRLAQDQRVKPIKIAVVEKNNEFWRGYPYGSRSSRNSLTITTLGEFVPEKEKKAFLVPFFRPIMSIDVLRMFLIF